jgi:hypothetical protein
LTNFILLPPDHITILKEADEVLLSWIAVTGASAYKVERSTLPEGPYTDISDLGEFSETGFSIDLPQADKQFFRLSAIRN